MFLECFDFVADFGGFFEALGFYEFFELGLELFESDFGGLFDKALGICLCIFEVVCGFLGEFRDEIADDALIEGRAFIASWGVFAEDIVNSVAATRAVLFCDVVYDDDFGLFMNRNGDAMVGGFSETEFGHE